MKKNNLGFDIAQNTFQLHFDEIKPNSLFPFSIMSDFKTKWDVVYEFPGELEGNPADLFFIMDYVGDTSLARLVVFAKTYEKDSVDGLDKYEKYTEKIRNMRADVKGTEQTLFIGYSFFTEDGKEHPLGEYDTLSLLLSREKNYFKVYEFHKKQSFNANSSNRGSNLDHEKIYKLQKQGWRI